MGAFAMILAALFLVGSALDTGDSPDDDAEPVAVAAQPTPSAAETPAAHASYIDYVRGNTDYFAHYTDTALVDEGLQYCERYEAGADPRLTGRELKLAYMNPATEEQADASIYPHTGSTKWLCPEHGDPVGPKAPWTASAEYWGSGPHPSSPILEENFVAAQRAKASAGNASLSDEEILRNGRTVCDRLESGTSPRAVTLELLLEYNGRTDGGTAAGFLLPTAVYAFCPQFEDDISAMTE